jgi:hypothetical protein
MNFLGCLSHCSEGPTRVVAQHVPRSMAGGISGFPSKLAPETAAGGGGALSAHRVHTLPVACPVPKILCAL